MGFVNVFEQRSQIYEHCLKPTAYIMNFNSQHISVFFAFKIINHLTTNSSAQTLPHSSEVVGQLRDHKLFLTAQRSWVSCVIIGHHLVERDCNLSFNRLQNKHRGSCLAVRALIGTGHIMKLI